MEEETLQRHRSAFDDPFVPGMQELDMGGQYQWRRHGEFHQWNPEAIAKLQYATRANDPRAYREFAQEVNDQSRRMATLRGLFEFRDLQPIDLDEVEPAVEIVKRFATGAISLGSISREAHETMAIAMNQLARAATPAKAARISTAILSTTTVTTVPAPSSRWRRVVSALRPITW